MENVENLKMTTNCRVCDGLSFLPVADLGVTPLADVFPEKMDTEERVYPLQVSVCTTCFHVQMLSTVNPEKVFGEEYGFYTGTSPSLVKHFEKFASDELNRLGRTPESVIEIASNDGTLLEILKGQGVKQLLGIDPSEAAEEAERKGIRTIKGFFDESLGERVVETYGKADLVIANNVIAHVDNPRSLVAGIAKVLKEGGTFIGEMHHSSNLILGGQFDNIYHEHLSFWSLAPLIKLFGDAGLDIFDVSRVDTQGGSIRVHATHSGEVRSRNKSVANMLNYEELIGLRDLDTYRGYQARVNYVAQTLREKIAEAKDQGKVIAGYGASAKSNTLLNFCGIDYSTLNYVVDTTPAKIGKFTPGTKIPIISPDMEKSQPDIYLLLIWNYLGGILQREQKFIKNGGQFLVPIPSPVTIP